MQRTRRRRDDRGALSIEFLLIMSALILVFMLMLQYAVKAHAQRVARAAAEEALAAATAYDGTAAAGESAGKRTLDDLGILSNAAVDAQRGSSTASVTVRGDAEQLIPFLSVRVSVQLEGPVESFVETP